MLAVEPTTQRNVLVSRYAGEVFSSQRNRGLLAFLHCRAQMLLLVCAPQLPQSELNEECYTDKD